MTKFRIDTIGRWSGGAGVVLNNARLAARRHPELFADNDPSIPIFFRNVVPRRFLLCGSFVYMPQNAWPWEGLALGIREKLRRNFLRFHSEWAFFRARASLRAGPSVPMRRRVYSAVLPNVPDEEFEQALERSSNKSEFGSNYFLSIGSCWGYRDFPTLLSAYHLYRQAGGCRPLVIATAGPRLAETKALAGQGVHFVESRLTRTEVLSLMRAAHAIVFTSSVEAAPLTVLEAVALGKRVIASHIPGHTAALEAVEARNVAYYTTNDSNALLTEFMRLDPAASEASTSRLDTSPGRSEAREQWCDAFARALSSIALISEADWRIFAAMPSRAEIPGDRLAG